jgi:hypothetical protein
MDAHEGSLARQDAPSRGLADAVLDYFVSELNTQNLSSLCSRMQNVKISRIRVGHSVD